jgi:hypothetical protein
MGEPVDAKGLIPESWLCIDCGFNTAPGLHDRAMIEVLLSMAADDRVRQRYGPDTEVYIVREKVWAKAGMDPMGGCLCIGCLERRLGRRLRSKDFPDHPLNWTPGTERLLHRRGPR